MANYNSGYNAELRIIHALKAAGYSVTRGAGSKGECFGLKTDLIATFETRTRTETAHIHFREYAAGDEIVMIQLKSKKKR